MPRRTRADVAPQPHDALIKFTFSQREHAAGLLKASLPPEVIHLVTWSTLELETIDFVDRALRGRHADLLFSARMGDERLYLYALIEQQREVQALMILRMGSYMWRQWERLVRDQPSLERLPPILPILIHHSETGWTAATCFEDIIQTGEPARAALLPFIPRFRMLLCDLSPGRSSGLANEALTALGQVVLWSLSVAGDDERLQKEIAGLADALNEVFARPDAIDAALALLRYLVATHVALGAPRIAKLMEKAARKGQKEVKVDVLDELKREGREEGRREGEREGERTGRREGKRTGRREGRAQTLLELLAARFGAVPAETKAQILASTEATLARWSLRVLTAPTLAAVLDSAASKPAKKAASTRRPPARKRARSAT
jgi:predicted transposase YdaD